MEKDSYLKTLILYGIIILFMSYVLDGFYVDSFITAIIVAFLLSLLNGMIKPIITLISWPITFLSLGLFKLVINGFMLYLCDLLLGPKFEVYGAIQCVLSALIMSLLSNVVGVDELKWKK